IRCNHKWGFFNETNYLYKRGGSTVVNLYDDERIDRLVSKGHMPIIQSSTVFSYSLDAVLLADFAYIPIKKGNILYLGTGNGVIPLLLSNRTKANITGLEIQERLADMARRSVNMNDLDDKIKIITGDLREQQMELGQSSFDVVTSNPPYFKTPSETEHNKNE